MKKIKIAFSDFWPGFDYKPNGLKKTDNVFYSMLSERFNLEIIIITTSVRKFSILVRTLDQIWTIVITHCHLIIWIILDITDFLYLQFFFMRTTRLIHSKKKSISIKSNMKRKSFATSYFRTRTQY